MRSLAKASLTGGFISAHVATVSLAVPAGLVGSGLSVVQGHGNAFSLTFLRTLQAAIDGGWCQKVAACRRAGRCKHC